MVEVGSFIGVLNSISPLFVMLISLIGETDVLPVDLRADLLADGLDFLAVDDFEADCFGFDELLRTDAGVDLLSVVDNDFGLGVPLIAFEADFLEGVALTFAISCFGL